MIRHSRDQGCRALKRILHRRIALVVTLLLTGSGIWLQAAGASTAVGEILLPNPDLSGLETTVADQLREYREIAVAQSEDADASAEDVAAAVGELGRYYHAYDLAGAAETCYRVAARVTPEDFRWHYLLGYLLQGEGRFDDAETSYLRALEIYRAAPPALLRLAEVYVELDRLEAAASLMREALALDPSSPATEAALGELYQRLGRHREAIDLLTSALEKVPDANRLYYPLALAHRAMGEADEARRLMGLQGRVGIRPADPFVEGLEALKTGERVHLLRGQTAFRAGRYEEAAEAFRLALQAEPESIAARIDLGSALAELGRSEEALVEFERVLELAPANPTALYNAGVLRGQGGDTVAAFEHLSLAARLEPEDAAIRRALAEVLVLEGELEEAAHQFGEAAELEPPGEGARLGQAQVLSLMGRFAEVRDRLEEGLGLLPSSGLLAHALSRLLAMGPDLAVRDGERALVLAESVFAAQPTADHSEVVAAALAELGRCTEAMAWQTRSIESSRSEADLAARTSILELYSEGPPCRYPGG